MRIAPLVAAAAASAALFIVPGLAAGDPPVGSPSGDHSVAGEHPAVTTPTTGETPPSTPGPSSSASAKAKAYGKYCQSEPKKHVAGQKGTPFSRCVTAMAKVATDAKTNPTTACKGLSKKHVAGQQGTQYSLCIKAAAKLKADDGQS